MPSPVTGPSDLKSDGNGAATPSEESAPSATIKHATTFMSTTTKTYSNTNHKRKGKVMKIYRHVRAAGHAWLYRCIYLCMDACVRACVRTWQLYGGGGG